MSPEALRLAVDANLAQVHRYFREHGEDPLVITPEFFLYHLSQGETAAEIFRIAINRGPRR